MQFPNGRSNNGLPMFDQNGNIVTLGGGNKNMDNENINNFQQQSFQQAQDQNMNNTTEQRATPPVNMANSNNNLSGTICKVSVLGEDWTIKVEDLIFDPHNPITYSKINSEKKTVIFDKRLVIESTNVRYSSEVILKNVVEIFMIEAGIYSLEATPQWIAHNMQKINKVYSELLVALKFQI